jgi:hypothetical protein
MVTEEIIIMAEPPTDASSIPAPIERVQTGVRMEKRMLKVLKALAEYHDFSLGELLEGIVLHAFENKPPFTPETLQKIVQLKAVYGMDYDARMSHRLAEEQRP